ncbi:hypothetical protein K3G39_07520 [Pontibacter sp. HSC-14F20]|uniref:hypothetical protein n=1 Tax=Pontibacter sp. HSC-14F20 TaxID=2864136 RepID=UPI001C737307|nr:hypothetical protein [Pontibacter sp. HSC-14F20]MBX0333083.1 hypothetical protein [Pontibacter sp. HSC-14F20]
MVNFLLSRKTDFFFWTGIALGIATTANFGAAYTEVDYMQGLFPLVSVLLFLLSGMLATFFFGAKTESLASWRAAALEV